VQVKEKYW